MADSSPTGRGPAAEIPSAAFVLCIEGNETRDQALLLIESIRAFGGALAGAPIFAVAPRQRLGIDAATRARLDALQATYHEAPLNTVCPEYGSANRVYAAAWAADEVAADTLIVLDSDTLVLGELDLGDGSWDLAARPVDVKGSTTTGLDDPFEGYWVAVAKLAGCSLEALPFVTTVLDHQRVRASYNGGLSIVRRASGILQRAAELFTRSVLAGLRPYAGHVGHRVFASTGFVAPRAGEYWGSNQAALAIAAWSSTRRVRELDRRHNVPLHGLVEPGRWSDDWSDLRPSHVHYHWMLRDTHRDLGLATLARIGVSAEQRRWIADRTPIGARGSRPTANLARGRQIIVCGMHRSATSLIASVLRDSGLDLGTRLLGAGPGNERGHFEDRDFWRLHEDMLAAAGCTALTAPDDFAPVASAHFVARARALVEHRAAREPWGWKDPRTLLFLDFWQALLPEARYVVLYRHPVEVALSLRRRATEPEVRLVPWTGLHAWEVYNRRALALIERYPEQCFVAQVPTVTADLAAFVRRVADKLGVPLDATRTVAGFYPDELADSIPAGGLGAEWQETIPAALELYRRLEGVADLPSAASAAGSPVGGDRTLGSREHELAVLLHELRAAPQSPAAGRKTPWTLETAVMDSRRRATLLQAELDASRREVTSLTHQLAATAADREALAETLAAIEGSRSFGIVAAWWRLVRRVRARPFRGG